MSVGITRSILSVFGIVSIDAGRYVSVPVVFLLETMLFFNSGVYGFYRPDDDRLNGRNMS
jgi:hypothetical protein